MFLPPVFNTIEWICKVIYSKEALYDTLALSGTAHILYNVISKPESGILSYDLGMGIEVSHITVALSVLMVSARLVSALVGISKKLADRKNSLSEAKNRDEHTRALKLKNDEIEHIARLAELEQKKINIVSKSPNDDTDEIQIIE